MSTITVTISTTFWQDHVSRMDDENVCTLIKAGVKRTTVEGDDAAIANLLSDAKFYGIDMAAAYTAEGYGSLVGAAKRTVAAIERQMDPDGDHAPTYWKPTPLLPAHAEAPTSEQVLAAMQDCLAEHGLDEKGWTAVLNTRAKSVYGRCYYRDRRVDVSWQIARLNPMSDTMDTIRHEVAHALAGPYAGHGPVWKEWCTVTGASPTRYYYSKTVETPWMWAIVCTGCGEIAGRRKKQPRIPGGWTHKPSACSAFEEGRSFALKAVHRRDIPATEYTEV